MLQVQVDALAGCFLQVCQIWREACDRIAIRLYHNGLQAACGVPAAKVHELKLLLASKFSTMLARQTR